MTRALKALAWALVLTCVLSGEHAQAQGPLPVERPVGLLPGQMLTTGPNGMRAVVESAERGKPPAMVAATGGPDQFGYAWDSSAPFGWIDATGGTKTGLNGTYQYSGPINMPFAFKYYENSYSQIYISTHGIVGFNDQVSMRGQQSAIPEAGAPNNVIAPYWAPEDASTGGIYYAQGGSMPNRYFVVEWYQVRDSTASSRLTFEAVLYENGDILFQYQTMNVGSSRWALSIGIEDAYGLDGLKYSNSTQPNNKAVRFTRPAAAARSSVNPPNNGRFTTVAAIETFALTVRNTGDFGADTFDLIPSSAWPVSLVALDGVTPLSDSNSTGYADTGSLGPGSARTFLVKIQTPSTLNVGDSSNATLTIRSAIDPGSTRTVNLSTASPAPFAAVFSDHSDYAMSLYLSHPLMQTVKKATGNNYYGSDPSILELPGGNFLYAWDLFHCLDNNCNVQISDIEYSLLNSNGNTVRPVAKLTNHSGASLSTIDATPALAVSPNGRIGIFWYQYTYDASFNYKYNLFFALLDSTGNVITGPLNITGNNSLNTPQFYLPRIAATADNRFVLGWGRYDQNTGANNIGYAVLDSAGNFIHSPALLTSDGNNFFHSLRRAGGNDVVFTWLRPWDIHYEVVNSAGNVSQTDTNLTNDGQGRFSSDAALLSDGKLAVAWTNYDGSYPGLDQMAFAILDSSYSLQSGPVAVDNPAAVHGNNYVSVAPDQSGHAILSWLDSSNIFHIYYALVGADGSILTQPMVMHTSESVYQLTVNYNTGGLTTYSQPYTSNRVDMHAGGVPLSGGAPNGAASLLLSASNSGLSPSGSINVTATLDSNLTFLSADPPPVSVSRSQLRPSNQAIRWVLPNLDFMGVSQIVLRTGVPNAPVGTQYPVNWSLVPSTTEDNLGDNSFATTVFVARQNYLPMLIR